MIRSYAKRLPATPGVYRMLDEQGEVLYVGKAKALSKRVISYTRPAQLSVRIQRMVARTSQMEFAHTHTEAEALLLESNLIKKLRPPFNVVFRDDKSFPYIVLHTDHAYPRAVKYRGGKKKDGTYFGPFASAGAVNRTLEVLQKVFLIRNCTDHVFANRSRPCLQYHIKRCTAPCVDYVSKEDYAAQIDDAQAFLSGKTAEVREKLHGEMQELSEALEYERAAELRNRLQALNAVTAHQEINMASVGDVDIIGLHAEGGKVCCQVFFFRGGQNYGNRATIRPFGEDLTLETVIATFIAQFYENKPIPPIIYVSHMPEEQHLIEEAFSARAGRKVRLLQPVRGEKRKLIEFALRNAQEELTRHVTETATQKQLLQNVAELFDLTERPKRIEVYDNSHLGGTGMVGAMIVAGEEGFRKTAYRKFTMREAAAHDDYAMMREMMTRRFSRALREGHKLGHEAWPDLLLIDGGKGQLSSVMEVLQELEIVDQLNVVAISKGPDRHAGREEFHLPGRSSFTLPPDDAALHFLQRLRDEAHRFAIGAQRTKRKATIETSPLDGIPGIGARKKSALLKHFGSAREVARAGVEDLMSVAGISRSLAEEIYRRFHS